MTVCDLPEWLEEFTENLEDTEMPVPAHISQDSDSEHPTKVVTKSRRHSIYTLHGDSHASSSHEWIQFYPCKTKTSQETEKSLRKFFESSQKPKVIFTDNSLELGNHVKIYHGIIVLLHLTDPRNGIAERAVRRVEEGTSAVLLQSGLDEKWWAYSVERHCYLRNVQDFLAEGKTPYERRHGEPFKWPIIPFGAMVEYHPTSPKDQARIHQFGKKV